ncbi:MAG: helix-turn-helix transcriptional regulator [Chitinophagaceae bacterium]|nr:helix-turn-helix transcriptional regulator [Chitinophagaceae bacterium]
MGTRIKKPKKQVSLENISPKEEILRKLGETIKSSRKKKGFTSFEHFAYQMDISRSLYAKYEAGSDLRVSTLFRIIQGMGMKVSEFFKGFD